MAPSPTVQTNILAPSTKNVLKVRCNIYSPVKITWNYGGRDVYIIGSFTNWDYMIKMQKNVVGVTPIFEISMVTYSYLIHSTSKKAATIITLLWMVKSDSPLTNHLLYTNVRRLSTT